MEGSRKAKAPSEMTIKRATNGGYIVRHHFDNSGAGESYRSPEEHAFGSHKDMMAHVGKHLTDGTGDGFGGGKDTTPQTHDKPAGKGKVTGIAGKPKAAAPSQKTKGAGVD